jgi:ATP-dependent Lon protease
MMKTIAYRFDNHTSGPSGSHRHYAKPSVNAVPLIPAHEGVVFPSMTVGFQLDDASKVEALQAALPESREVLIVPLAEEASMAEQVGNMVTRARVVRFSNLDKGVMVLVEGLARNRLDEVYGAAPTQTGTGSLVVESDAPAEDEYWQAAVRNLREAAGQLVASAPDIPDQVATVLDQLQKPSALTDFLAANLNLSLDTRRALLAELNVVRRVDRLQAAVDEQLRIVSLQEKLRENVQHELTDAQRRAYLREQMRAIQKELGEDDGTDQSIAELQSKLDEAGIPEQTFEQVQKELDRLQRLPAASPDYASTVDYLETVAALPWAKRSDGNIDLTAAEAVLDRDHYGLEKVKRRLLEYLAVRKLNPEGRGPILCLVGPPGVGKTSLGQSVAHALGREFVRVALGGVRDEAEIRGHRRTYVGSMMGRIMTELKRAGFRDPVMMLDEIDKMGSDLRGDPSSALLEVLDPAQNQAFVDHYLNLPFDLSQVVFITTANVLDTIPAPLRDRMEVINLSGYTPTEKREIATRYLLSRQRTTNGLSAEQLTWDTDAVEFLIEHYTREAGVRLLEQKLAAVIRYGAARVAKGEVENFRIDEAAVREALGPPNSIREQVLATPRVGIVNGLAYTPVGGEVLPIEALRYEGKGSLRLTGQLGSVMQESAQAAESLVKSKAAALGVNTDFANTDTHLHVPAGAIPKDGPSAGVAMFVALASLHSERKVRGDIGMTGEINLRGDVLPIGGLAEKTLAALSAGIKTVLIPRGNEKDIPELPSEVRESLTIVPVDSVDDVIGQVFV